MLSIGPGCDLRLEILLRQRVGQLAPDLQVLELLTIGQEIEYKDFHWTCPPARISDSICDGRGAEKTVQQESGLLYRGHPRCCEGVSGDGWKRRRAELPRGYPGSRPLT